MPRCKHCKTKFEPKYFLQKFCLETDECIIEFNEFVKAEKSKSEAKKWKQEKKVLKEKLKTLGQYESEAKLSFQKWIRLRDSEKPCISCKTKTDLMDGGHFKKAEIYSGVIFHEMNCHAQCRKCNRYLNGNELNYRLGLIERYGLEYATYIEDLANSTRQKKYTREELIAKKLQYDIKIKEFKITDDENKQND